MRTFLAFTLALATLFCFVKADCCDESNGLSGQCDDGTDATPCCNQGKCNVVCCACDGGCREPSYEGCLENASNQFGPTGLCTVCIGSACTDTTNPLKASCQQKYQAAIAGCKSRFGVSKRGAETFGLTQRRDTAANNSSSELLSLVDKDGSGNLNVAESIDFISFKYPTTKESPLLLKNFVAYFHVNKFDKNGDGVVHIDEHHRVTDD